MKLRNGYKMKFKPASIKRLFARPRTPHKMVGYPTAENWARYYDLNYKFMIEETKLERAAAKVQQEHGPFADDYARVSA